MRLSTILASAAALTSSTVAAIDQNHHPLFAMNVTVFAEESCGGSNYTFELAVPKNQRNGNCVTAPFQFFSFTNKIRPKYRAPASNYTIVFTYGQGCDGLNRDGYGAAVVSATKACQSAENGDDYGESYSAYLIFGPFED